ncbi:Toll-6 Toll-like receptor 6 [Candida maltosa Xu316]
MVYNYSGSFKFNSGDFVNLKVLWFEDSNIKFVNSLPDGLKSLYLFPNKFGWNNNSSISVNQKLPDGLTSLVFGNCTIGNIIAPGSLSSIQLEKVKDATEHYNFVRSAILTSLVNGKLQELKIDSIWNSRRMIANVPDLVFHDAEISKNLYKLTTLSVDGFLPNLTHCLNLKKLQISKITNATDFDNYKFPGSLEELALTYNNITNLFTIDKNITGTNLRVLNLADNPIHWSSYIPNFKRFNKLKSLKLSNTHIGSNFPKIKYPDSIEALSLEVNQITSLDGIEFPANLKNLGIGSNFISKIEYPHFPTTLETIHLTENKISKVDLSRNSRHESLKIEILYLNYCKLTKFNNVNISQYVKILNFDNCKLSTISNIGFPDTLLELSFSGCGLTSFENILWGDHPRLRYLNLSQNSLTKFDIRLPSSIQSINLSMNNLTQLSNSLLSHKDNLKVLNLSSNKFQRFIYSFNITNLQNLDLSFNSLKLINLTFPKYSHTRLKVLNLCSNKLSELHPVMIGHDKNLTMHTNLIEIDLTNNKIKPDDITKQIDKFPDSLLCFFIGHTGEQDRFGYDLAKNIINHEICTGKRIDIP